MINIIQSDFENVIFHTIFKKGRNEDHSSIEYEQELLDLESDVIELLKLRINNAIGIESKSFELSIANVAEDSFFDFVTNIMDDSESFIENSQRIASKLATSQKNGNISGGYLLLIQGKTADENKFIIALKAEVHDALSLKKDDGISKMELVEDIFLSPAAKFYKLGIIYENKNLEETYPNDLYSCILFDNQFNPKYTPAEFFYHDFLGFDISTNDKIKTRRFFDDVNQFIYSEIEDKDLKMDLVNAFRSFIKTDQTGIIDPEDIRERLFSMDEQVRERFSTQVLIDYPRQFIKNTLLLDFSLKRKSVFFPNKVKIEAPEDSFLENVKIFTSMEQLAADESEGTFSIIKVIGNPYAKE